MTPYLYTKPHVSGRKQTYMGNVGFAGLAVILQTNYYFHSRLGFDYWKNKSFCLECIVTFQMDLPWFYIISSDTIPCQPKWSRKYNFLSHLLETSIWFLMSNKKQLVLKSLDQIWAKYSQVPIDESATFWSTVTMKEASRPNMLTPKQNDRENSGKDSSTFPTFSRQGSTSHLSSTSPGWPASLLIFPEFLF